MAATGFTPISLYYSATASVVPLAANLIAGELALNTADGKLFYKNSSGVVTQLAGGGAAGDFTNLSYSGTLTGGTGVVNLGSGQFYKAASGNVGIGNASPSSWGSGYTGLEINAGLGFASNAATSANVLNNAYYNGTNWIYKTTNFASRYALASGGHNWYTAPSGTAAGTVTFTQSMTLDANGKLGIGTTTPAVTLAISATDAILAPVGTTAQRPTGATGYIRYNSTLSQFEGYGASSWGAIGGGATGGLGAQAFWENDVTISASYTITTSKNAGTFGPVTISSGASFTGATSGISTSLTTSSVTGTILIGQTVTGTNLTAGTVITAFVSGVSGGAGVYTINPASTGTVSGTVTSSTIVTVPSGSTWSIV